jgi:nucleotide-binding universal stress UspA family protein
MSKCYVLGYSRDESAREAARWAAERLLPDGKLVIVHATRDLRLPASPLTGAGDCHRVDRDIADELLLEGQHAMFDVDAEIEVDDQDPVSALCEAAARYDAEAIVVGCERHSRLHTAIGTVTIELLHRSPVPMIVVPPRVELSQAEQKRDGSARN